MNKQALENNRIRGLDVPYAVYGTLRSGEGNDRLWHGLARSQGLGTVDGFRLVSNGGFPYALPSQTNTTVVEIVEPLPDDYAQQEVRTRLDRLEGYPQFYDRKLVMVKQNNQEITCWMYIPADDHERLGRLAQVPNNDWANAQQLEMSGGWR